MSEENNMDPTAPTPAPKKRSYRKLLTDYNGNKIEKTFVVEESRIVIPRKSTIFENFGPVPADALNFIPTRTPRACNSVPEPLSLEAVKAAFEEVKAADTVVGLKYGTDMTIQVGARAEAMKPLPPVAPPPPVPHRETRRYIHPTYTRRVFREEEFRELVDDLAASLERLNKIIPFDAIAGCGNSSVPILGALTYKTGIPLIATRKPGDPAHHSATANGYLGARYVIVDDLISSGKTVSGIINNIQRAMPYDCRDTKCVAIVLYDDFYGGSTYWQAKGSSEPIPVFYRDIPPERYGCLYSDVKYSSY